MNNNLNWSQLEQYAKGLTLDGRLAGRDVLRLLDLAPDELFYILAVALAQKRDWKLGEAIAKQPDRGTLRSALTQPNFWLDKASQCHQGQAVAIILEKPSLRTRVSFEVAVARLGAQPVVMSDTNSAFSRGETIKDTIMVLERFVDGIVMRTFAQARIEEVAKWASVPVVNALTDDYHPCQVLADLLTMYEHKGDLSKLKVAYVGDGSNNMANSFMEGAALCGQHLRIAAPEGYEPNSALFAQCEPLASERGGSIEILRQRDAAIEGADVVITDTWTSMGSEAEHDQRLTTFEPYRVDAKAMSLAAPGAIFEHCLPAHRGEEVTDEVMDGPASVIYDEAENRMHAQKALLSCVLPTTLPTTLSMGGLR
jgi:ornithine carbamoyltransferase